MVKSCGEKVTVENTVRYYFRSFNLWAGMHEKV